MALVSVWAEPFFPKLQITAIARLHLGSDPDQERECLARNAVSGRH